jgi:hypothetical protein
LQYLPSNHSYASIDADAYSHFGTIGALGVSLFLFGLCFLAALLETQNTLSQLLYTIFVVVLGTSLPVASLQAILSAQGICLIVLFLLLIKMLSKKEVGALSVSPT